MKTELTNLKEVDKVIANILKMEYCEQCGEDSPEEHTCYTCCGDEITGDIADIGLCPTCLEHI